MPCFFHAMGRVCHAVMQVVHHFPTTKIENKVDAAGTTRASHVCIR